MPLWAASAGGWVSAMASPSDGKETGYEPDYALRVAPTLREGRRRGYQRRRAQLRLLQHLRGCVEVQALRKGRGRQEHRIRDRDHSCGGRLRLARARSGRVRPRDGRRGRDPTAEARQSGGRARRHARVDRPGRHAGRAQDGRRQSQARSHDAFADRLRLSVPRGAARRAAAADAGGGGHDRALGRDLPDGPAAKA